MEVKIQKWVNSTGVRIPTKMLESLNIKENEELTITEYNNSLILKKRDFLSIEERLEGFLENDFVYTKWDPSDVQGREIW